MQSRCAVPFYPNIKPGNATLQAALALTAMIEQWQANGWSFCHLANVTTVQHNGCLAAAFGSPTTVLTVQVAILEWSGEGEPPPREGTPPEPIAQS